MATINFLIYVVVFFVAVGMTPKQAMSYAKMKIDTVITSNIENEEKAIELPEELQKELDGEREKIAKEMEELKSKKQQLINEKTELEALRAEVQKLINMKNKINEDRMYKLAKIYDGMDQESVAGVFEQMGDSLIVAILPKMKPGNASLVMEFLAPERSARISEMLLERM